MVSTAGVASTIPSAPGMAFLQIVCRNRPPIIAITNPIALLNDHILQEAKLKVCKAHYDKLGMTIPMSAIMLAMDADRNIRHSRTLATNIIKANKGQTRPDYTDAHHIVGRLDIRAEVARGYLFNWGIGINDADNGLFLPRYATTKIASMPNASNHQGLHTETYYLAVTMRMFAVADRSGAAGRIVLKTIKGELVAGTFPY